VARIEAGLAEMCSEMVRKADRDQVARKIEERALP
jgi:hypothetical protein